MLKSIFVLLLVHMGEVLTRADLLRNVTETLRIPPHVFLLCFP